MTNRRRQWERFPVGVICLIASLSGACTPMCPSTRPLRVPAALVIAPESSADESYVRAYTRVFEATGLTPRIIPPSGIGTLSSSREQLIIAVPARTGQFLSSAWADELLRLVETGATLVSEEYSLLAEKAGFRAGDRIEVSGLRESERPDVTIEWERPAHVKPPRPPAGATVLAVEPETDTPLVSLVRRGQGRILMLAAELDPEKGEGYARFPFLPQELTGAGITFPFRAERVSAFCDTGYRRNDSPEALARRWRQAGFRAIHASAWYFFDGSQADERYLEALIPACHQNGILVYAWLELPHVSRKFWDDHPEWREKTATGEDAHLDWRYLMNLEDPACFDAIRAGLNRMIRRFDWDGANSAEIYFDSPGGPDSPESFTPFNTLVRDRFKALSGIDPVDFLRPGSPQYRKKKKREWQGFVDYRVGLERDLNERMLRELSGMKNSSGEELGLALTYVDDLYDPRMREAVGADVPGMMPLLERFDFTLIMEDPGTVWHLGPRRYSELGARYAGLTSRRDRLGIDINIVDRDQAAYPTQKQTGTEFLQLFHNAGASFNTVMVYSEHTIYDWDLDLMANAMTRGVRATADGPGIRITSPGPFVFRTGIKEADFLVDGQEWPCVRAGEVLLPAGNHSVSAKETKETSRPHLEGLNGELQDAAYDGPSSIVFRYVAQVRGAAVFDRRLAKIHLDGNPLRGSGAEWVILPGGLHRVQAWF
jgi:hypothetical protein